jgi:hypothetical protein
MSRMRRIVRLCSPRRAAMRGAGTALRP